MFCPTLKEKYFIESRPENKNKHSFTASKWNTQMTGNPREHFRLMNNSMSTPVHQLSKTCTLIAVIKPNAIDISYMGHNNKNWQYMAF